MRIGTDGPVATPDPDVIVHLDDTDIEAVIEALHVCLTGSRTPRSDAVWGEPWARALKKFETLTAWEWDRNGEDEDDA